MGVPRRQAIAQIAKELCLENPESITFSELERQIDALPVPNWLEVEPQELRNRLADELDGARPYA